MRLGVPSFSAEQLGPAVQRADRLPLDVQIVTPSIEAYDRPVEIAPGGAVAPPGGFSVIPENSAPGGGYGSDVMDSVTDVGLSEFLGLEPAGESFFAKNKGKILIGGGLGLAVLAGYLVMRRK